MKVHHLNCGTLCPMGHLLIPGVPRRMVCHCLLLETPSGLILVDTGLGTQDVAKAPGRIGIGFRLFAGPKLKREETAVEQVRRLGFKPEDVRHIVLTHLDVDHAGGLADFPWATVHVAAAEFVAALAPATFTEARRYRKAQWAHRPKFEVYSQGGESWFGFEAVRNLAGVPDDILMIPLPGHTLGHCGVAVKTGDQWLLHAGDAYFHHAELTRKRRISVPWSMRAFQNLMQVDRETRLDNQWRLRDLLQENGEHVSVFCSHDSKEFDSAQT